MDPYCEEDHALILDDAVRATLTESLPEWHRHNPHLLVMTERFDNIPALAQISEARLSRIMTRLDGYSGSSNINMGIPAYRLLPLVVTQRLEVLLLTPGLTDSPVEAITADLISRIGRDTSALDVDDEFIFRAPESILHYLEGLTPSQRSRVRTLLYRRMEEKGLRAESHMPLYQLQIRKTGVR